MADTDRTELFIEDSEEIMAAEEFSAEETVTEDILVEEETEDGSVDGVVEDDEEDPSHLIDAGQDDETAGTLTSGNMIGVRFRITGRIYYFDAGEFDVHRGDHVIVETVRGMEYGYVVADPAMLASKRSPKPLKKILRIADAADDEQAKANRVREREALKICQPRIREHGLEMKLIDAEYTFDNSKLLFYFTADGRVDFRELVKDLATIFRMRIELRQIGVRDETQILGGYGICGRVLCCHSFLSDFAPVSIKMAKEQSLSLNQTKISGVCGRLMCCLKNEEETYEELKRSLPGIGDEVEGNDGLVGEVSSVNVLRQTIKILVEVDDEKELHEYGEGEWTLIRKRRRGQARHSKKEQEKQPAEKKNENAKPAAEAKAESDAAGKESAKKEQRGQNESGGTRRRPKERKNKFADLAEIDTVSSEKRSGRNGGRNRKKQDAAAEQNNTQNAAPSAGTAQAGESRQGAGRGENGTDNSAENANGQAKRRRGGHFNRRRRGGAGRGNGDAQQNDAGTEN